MKWIKAWWGDTDAEFNNYLGLPYHPPHWSAQWVRTSARFCASEWKWFIGIAIAVIGLIVRFL